MEKLLRYLDGYIKILLTGKQPERFLKLCAARGLVLRNLEKCDEGYQLELALPDIYKISGYLRKTGCRIHILRKKGMSFFFYRNKKRKAFFAGIVLCLVLMYVSSLYVWEIQVYGNHYYAKEAVLEELEQLDVRDGVLIRSLDCLSLASGIRAAFPQVVWVSVRTEGTCLIVDLKENEDDYLTTEAGDEIEAADETAAGYDLTAPRDGTILSMITRSGMPCKREGDTCEKGEVLVTGLLPILNQDGEVARYESVQADADIIMETEYAYYDEFDSTITRQEVTGEERSRSFLTLGSLRLNWPIEYTEQTNIYETVWKLHITDTFYLPVSIGKTYYEPYQVITETLSEDEASELSREHVTKYMRRLVEEGKTVVSPSVRFYQSGDKWITRGTITVQEKVEQKKTIDEIPLIDMPKENQEETE